MNDRGFLNPEVETKWSIGHNDNGLWIAIALNKPITRPFWNIVVSGKPKALLNIRLLTVLRTAFGGQQTRA